MEIGTIGYMPMTRAAKADIVKAKAVGLDIGLVRHIDHYGSAGHYSRMCMEAGCIGFSSQGHHNMGNAERLGTQAASRLLRKSVHQLYHSGG